MVRRVALLGVLACCLTLTVGCVAVQPKPDGSLSFSLFPPSSQATVTAGSKTSRPSGGSTGTSRANSASSDAPGTPSYPGKTLKSGNWTVVVEDTSSPKRLQDGSRPAPGKKFVVVEVTIRNTGSGAALEVRPSQFTFKDSAYRVVKPYKTKLDMYNARSVRPINAGMGGYAPFVYEVPIGSGTHSFTFTPKQGATGSMSWWVP